MVRASKWKKTTGIAFSLVMVLAAAVIALSLAPQMAEAESGFWTSAGCTNCHAPTPNTCNGCHAHGTHPTSAKSSINVAGATNKTSYAPGETVSVTITGGYRTGWIRALLYDQNMVERGRSTGTATGGMGGGAGYPIMLSAPAPTTAGTYQWTVAWYGNQYDLGQTGGTTIFGPGWTPDASNPNHGEERVKTNSFTVTAATDTTPPTVTINQATGQADPTSSSPINFTVVFSETVTGFTSSDVTISGTAGGTKTVTVSGTGPTYNVAVSGMNSNGTVIATIAAGMAQDLAGNLNTASTSTDNAVTYTVADTTPPSVTINQATGQADPTSSSPINFTVVFSEAVTGFTSSDVTISGTAGGTKTVTVSGTGPTYNVAVSGMNSNGTVIATIAAGMAQDLAGNSNTASTSTDNTVTYTVADTTPPSVTINQAAGQADPTSSSPINFTVVFSEAVTGFTSSDVTISGTAGGTKTVTVSGTGPTYNVAVSGMNSNGTVIATIAAGMAQDLAGNSNMASTSTDNTVTYTVADTTPPSVTINQAAGQADPTSSSPINFTVVFSEAVTGFTSSDVTISGTAGGTKTVTVSGTGPTYNVAVSGMNSNGTVIATIAAGMAQDLAGNSNTASTSTDNTVTYTVADTTPPSVTINQAAGQADPTSSSPINFTVVFSEAVTGFTSSDVTISGTAGGTKTVTVSGTGPTYNVAVSGMNSNGTVIATIAAGMAQDLAGNSNTASTSTDNTVTYNAQPVTGPDLSIWVGQWLKVSIQNRGYYNEDEQRLSSDRHSFSGYLNITAWDPSNNVLQATLFSRGEGKASSVPLSLNYISGTNLNFLCASHVALGDNSYGFTARITGVMNGGVLTNGTLTTIAGYHAESSGEAASSLSNSHSAGWLRITGKMVPESKVPGDFLQ